MLSFTVKATTSIATCKKQIVMYLAAASSLKPIIRDEHCHAQIRALGTRN